MARRSDDYEREAAEIQSVFNRFRQLDQRAQFFIIGIAILALVVVGLVYLRIRSHVGSAPSSPQMLLGNPSGATDSFANRDNYLMVKPYFALSYNSSRGIPNWVSWQVRLADLGKAPRKVAFDPDTTLPAGFNQVTTQEYTGSGFDRGHMCPHSDRAANQDMSFATFVMTNIIPQAPNVNRKAWERLEAYSRELVERHNRAYIIAGPAGQGGRGSKKSLSVLEKGNVTVPAECWKIVVVVPEAGGDDDLANINAGTRVIAVIMPNDHTKVGEDWAGFRTSPAEIERKTGLHFFDRLRPDIASALRQKVDNEPITQAAAREYHDRE